MDENHAMSVNKHVETFAIFAGGFPDGFNTLDSRFPSGS